MPKLFGSAFKNASPRSGPLGHAGPSFPPKVASKSAAGLDKLSPGFGKAHSKPSSSKFTASHMHAALSRRLGSKRSA